MARARHSPVYLQVMIVNNNAVEVCEKYNSM